MVAPVVPIQRALARPDFDRMHLPEEYWRARVDQVPNGVREAAERYLVHIKTMLMQGVGLLVLGPPGTGKTAIAALVLKEARSFGVAGYFTTVWELRELLRARAMFDAEQNVMERCRDVGVLVLDDLQIGDADGYLLDDKVISGLLTSRRTQRRLTVLTTQMDLADFRSAFPLCTSAVRGTLVPLHVDGVNRWESKQRAINLQVLGREVSPAEQTAVDVDDDLELDKYDSSFR